MVKILGYCTECGELLYEGDVVYRKNPLYNMYDEMFCSQECVLNYFDISYSENDLYLLDDEIEVEEFWEVLEYFNLEEIVLKDEEEEEEWE